MNGTNIPTTGIPYTIDDAKVEAIHEWMGFGDGRAVSESFAALTDPEARASFVSSVMDEVRESEMGFDAGHLLYALQTAIGPGGVYEEDPIVKLSCYICSNPTLGRPWHAMSEGFGLCPECMNSVKPGTEYGETLIRFGVRGYHYDLVDPLRSWVKANIPTHSPIEPATLERDEHYVGYLVNRAREAGYLASQRAMIDALVAVSNGQERPTAPKEGIYDEATLALAIENLTPEAMRKCLFNVFISLYGQTPDEPQEGGPLFLIDPQKEWTSDMASDVASDLGEIGLTPNED